MGRCCQAAGANDSSPLSSARCQTALRWQAISLAGWILPTMALALMPKCPVCVAAYAAAFAGIGMSLTAASYLRTGLITIAVAGLMTMAAARLILICRSRRSAAR